MPNYNIVPVRSYLSNEIPEALYVYGVPLSICGQEEARMVDMGFKLTIDDGMEGFGMYAQACIFGGGNATDWYKDDAKIATRQIPEDWTFSVRDILGAIGSEECTPADYLVSEILRTMVGKYEVSVQIKEVEGEFRSTVSFFRKRHVTHEFVVDIPESAVRNLFPDDSSDSEEDSGAETY